MHFKKIASNAVLKPILYPGSSFRPNTFRGADVYFRLATLFNRTAVKQRDPLHWTKSPERCLDPEKGFDLWDLSADEIVMKAARLGGQELDYRLKEDKGCLDGKPFLKIFPIYDLHTPENRHYLELSKHPEILASVSQYLGMLPVVQQVALWYSPNDENIGRSQMYHLDSMDKKQVKVFIFMDQVTPSSGPLHVIRSDESLLIWEYLKRRGKVKEKSQKFNDEQIAEALGRDPGVALTGKAGTAALVDTCNCYHYGSRPTGKGNRARKILFIHYTTPFARNLRFRTPRTEPDIDAMLGVGLVPDNRRQG